MKSAGVTVFSRTIERTTSDLRLRRGRCRCCTHGRPSVVRWMNGLPDSAGVAAVGLTVAGPPLSRPARARERARSARARVTTAGAAGHHVRRAADASARELATTAAGRVACEADVPPGARTG